MTSSTTTSPSAAEPADVCLLLEGTYPYVRGGVSTWVHQIVSAMPDLTFAIVYIGAEKSAANESRYEIPGNVRTLHHTFLFDDDSPSSTSADPRAEAALREAASLLFIESTPSSAEAIDTAALDVLHALAAAAKTAPDGFDNFWEHRDTWQLIRAFYQRHLAGESFIDVYWNLRFMLRPLWRLCGALADLPPSKVYHSVSTGYAGVLGVLATERDDSAFLLSEHGIYVRERIAELLRADWSPPTAARDADSDDATLAPIPTRTISALRQLWIEQFVELGQLSYRAANRIVSLFQKNADHQVEFGAPSDRVSIIPNGITVSDFDDLREQRQAARRNQPERMNIGFLGRVVAIKDVKTLLRAAAVVLSTYPQARFLIMGPIDEDPDYADECFELTQTLHIAGAIEFTGSKTLPEALPVTDIMVLSSISEGLPFVALEAFGAGIPLIATDVGACRELVEGRHDEDPALGPAGAIVPVGEPAALGSAIIRQLADRDLQDRLGNAGRQRVERHYAENDIVAAYHELYVTLPQAQAQAKKLTTDY